MKTILKALMMALLMTAFTSVVTVAPAYAQTDELAENTALYKKFTDNRGGTLEQKKIALEAGKQYVEKYGSNKDYEAQVEYIKKDVVRLEADIKRITGKMAHDAIVARYDNNFNKNFDEVYAAGRDLLAENPNLIEVMIDLGSVGFEESNKPTPNTKYNADSINYSKQAIAKIEGGAKNAAGDYAGYYYTFGNGSTSTKDNTLGNLNYRIAYLMYFNQGQKKEAIPYFYKATKYDSSVKNLPVIYQVIGETYYAEVVRLNSEADALYKQADDIRKAENKDTDEAKAKEAAGKEKEGLAKGYAERTIDAYARAYKLASANANTKPAYKDGLYKEMQKLYRFRFDDKIEGFDAYIASAAGKPFVDPETTVSPVVIVAPAATTTSSSLSATPNSTLAANAPSATATGSATTKVGTGAAAATPAAAKTAAPAKAPAKKPAAKKKGTR